MKISSKGRYGLAVLLKIAQNHRIHERTTVAAAADTLNLSKIYLEQIFSLLKRNGIIASQKGPQGGYFLCRPPEKVTVWEVLSAAEPIITESAEISVQDSAPAIEHAMQYAYSEMDRVLKSTLEKITLADLLAKADENIANEVPMYYI